MYDVIDVSHHNGNIDFEKVKADGIKGVIIKAGGSDGAINYYVDKKFKENYEKAKKAGLLVGAYWFSGRQINNMAMGIRDADNFLKTIKGLQFELPVFMDYEVGIKSNKLGNTNACIGFCERMEDAGYFVGIYGSDCNTFNEMVLKDRLTMYYWWVARYSTKEPSNNYHMWQYTSIGRVKGVSTWVDISHVKTDVSEVIVRAGYNGFSRLN